MNAHEVVVRFFHDVDRQDWPAIRAALADVVHTDYTSLFGGEPEQLSADDLVARWRALLPGFDCTQHFLGPLTPAGTATDRTTETLGTPDELLLECNVRAHHRLAGTGSSADEWLVAGRYTISARSSGTSWLVAGVTLRTAYQAGEPALVDVATRRASERA